MHELAFKGGRRGFHWSRALRAPEGGPKVWSKSVLEVRLHGLVPQVESRPALHLFSLQYCFHVLSPGRFAPWNQSADRASWSI